ncbi:MAG: arsenical efflux pump membrane protein ArsB [Symploca sp. SIO1C2]|nr:arsenical efflux pump membrane protein ArsB [Symploca sp. SIO1C2]
MRNSPVAIARGIAAKLITIFSGTLTFIAKKLKGLGIPIGVVAGIIFALSLNIVTWEEISTVWSTIWNATFTLIALIIIALILDKAGFFRLLALQAAYWSLGRGRLLFILVLLLGASVATCFTNMGAALIWTSTVIEMLLLLGFSSRAILAFVFAAGLFADATSLLLPVSNSVNLISTDYFDIPFLRYFLVMLPVSCVAIATSLGVLWFFFDPYIPTKYRVPNLPSSEQVICDPLVCQWSWAIVGLLLIGYLVAQALAIPVCLIAGGAAVILLILAGRWFHNSPAIIPVNQLGQEVPWLAILLSLAMCLVVIDLGNVGMIELLSQLLEELANWGLTLIATGTAFLATLLSSVINNLPTVLINVQAIQGTTGLDPTIQEVMVYANVIGCTIGAKISPIGSLSTLIWLNILARKRLNLNWVQYTRMAIILTIPVLFVSLLSLAMWLPWLIA